LQQIVLSAREPSRLRRNQSSHTPATNPPSTHAVVRSHGRSARLRKKFRKAGLSWPVVEADVLGLVLEKLDKKRNDDECEETSAYPASPSRETLHS
jgi:hypothetical protein